MAVKKIPTYQEQKQASATFRAPTLQDGMSRVYKATAELGHNILDKQAAEEGETRGWEEVTQGTNKKSIKEISSKSEFTIRGQAYQKGARGAWVAQKNTEIDTELGNLFNTYKQTGDGESFQKDANKFRDKIAQETPSNMQKLLLPQLDRAIAGNVTKLAGIKLSNDIKYQAEVQEDRFNIITGNIADQIKTTGDAGDQFAEAIGIINTMVEQGLLDPSSINTYKDKLIVPIFEGEIQQYFNSLSDDKKADFVETINNQGVDYFASLDTDNNIIAKIQKKYTEDLKEILPDFQFGRPSDSQLAKMIKKASTDWLKTKEKDTELINYGLKNLEIQIVDGYANKEKSVDEFVTVESILNFGKIHNVDEDKINSLLRTHKIYSEAEALTTGIEIMSLDDLEKQIKDADNRISTADDTTEEGLLAYDINFLAKKQFQERIKGIADAYENGTIYQFLAPDWEIKNAEDIIARRNWIAKKLGNMNPENIPLWDKKEKENFKSMLSSMSVNDLVNATGLVEQLGISLDDPSILAELELDITREAIILMDDQKTKNILAQSEIRFSENELKLKSVVDDADISKAKTIDGHVATTMSELSTLPPVEFNRIQQMVKLIAYDLVANSPVGEEEAVKQAYDLFLSVYTPTPIDLTGQTLLIPTKLATNFEATEDYVNELISNPVKYGLVLPDSTTIDQFDFENKVSIEQRNGKLVLVQRDDDGISGIPIQVKNQQNAESDKISINRIEINIDSEKRITAEKNNNKNKHWDHEISKDSKKILAEPIKIADEYKNENITAVQNEIRKIEDEIAKIDAGKGPDSIKHALKMGPSQRLVVLQMQLQELMTAIDGPKNNDENYEIAYFKISQQSNFIDAFTQHITNVPNQQQVISGIMLKNAQSNAKWTEDELTYLSQYEAYEGLLDPAVREYVINNWDAMREQGGFETLRTGYKLTPAGTLYVLIQDAMNGTD